MFWNRWLNPPQETVEQMQRRLREEVRREPPDRPPLKFIPIEEVCGRGWDAGWGEAVADGDCDGDGGGAD